MIVVMGINSTEAISDLALTEDGLHQTLLYANVLELHFFPSFLFSFLSLTQL